MLQHAMVAVANPFEGYTTDDNARALQLAVLAGDDPHAPAIARRTLSFLHYALNPSTRRFRNFMAYDRHWLDEEGGENTQARAVRALVAAAHGLKGALGQHSQEMLSRSWAALDAPQLAARAGHRPGGALRMRRARDAGARVGGPRRAVCG